jgi:protoporphyrinogen oxidase
MLDVKYLILGAGPSGLALAHTLIDQGVPRDQLLVVEKESVAGGLCRSQDVDGAPLEIGGGHFLDLRRKEVLDFLFRFLPATEWETYQRVAKINLRGQEIDHPLESNLWQLPRADQVDYLMSIAQAGCVSGQPMPALFSDWVRWKLGERLAQDYMLPYNRKIWSMDLDRLGTYWLYKLPDVSFRDTLCSCLEGRPYGALPAHGTFMYPKRYGYGEVWRRMGEALGDRLVTDCPVTAIDLASRTVNGRWRAGTIISTIPWTLWPRVAAVPAPIVARIGELVNVSIDVDYHAESLPSRAHWIYEPREELAHHRLLARHNFCHGSRGHWTETNVVRSGPAVGFRHRNEFAYPVNTCGKREAMTEILTWAKGHGVIGAGRWGTWEHMNSDVAVAEGIKLGKALTGAERGSAT